MRKLLFFMSISKPSAGDLADVSTLVKLKDLNMWDCKLIGGLCGTPKKTPMHACYIHVTLLQEIYQGSDSCSA